MPKLISVAPASSLQQREINSCPRDSGAGKRSGKKRRSRMAKLANAFLEDEPVASSPPKMWSALSRFAGRVTHTPKHTNASCPSMNLNPQPDSSNLSIQEQIGIGSGGTTVHRCIDTQTNQSFALKVVPRADYHPSNTELMLMDQWEPVNSILPTHVSTRGSSTYISMELASGGDLLERILKHGVLSEKDTARIIQRVAAALSNLHKTMGVCHRDVKPENVCIKDPEDVTSVRLCDFEHARPLRPACHVYTQEESSDSAVGSLDYMAPERFYGVAAGAAGDCWSLGVLAYCLLKAELPFIPPAHPSDRQRPTLKPGVWDGLPAGAVSLMSGLLELNPLGRTGLEDVMADGWICQMEEQTTVQHQILKAHSQALELSRLVHLAEHQAQKSSEQGQECYA
eukprot:TRINITY_DN6028_c0_g1_i1.p1 TRINITY_DN6028_c0_g1~~TRINITY_DN6028_c0_g1_i1.p1  ORF type:complete len:398 (-),score=81.62 TRINITY_DN6028_c0_g1_i1:528-1721(-)